MNTIFILSLIICGGFIALSMALVDFQMFSASVFIYFIIAIAMFFYNRNKKA
jgi:hypothetical protein